MLSVNVATLGENIKRLREAAGIRTQGDLAARMGVPQPRASDLENDRYDWADVRLRTLLAVAKAIGVSLERVVEGLDGDYDSLGLTSPDRGASTDGGTNKKGGASDVVPASAQARIRELEDELSRLRADIRQRALDLSELATDEARLRSPRTHSAPRGRKVTSAR